MLWKMDLTSSILSKDWQVISIIEYLTSDSFIDKCIGDIRENLKDFIKCKICVLYDLEMPLRQRVELIAKEVYGADGVIWLPLAVEKAQRFESDPKYADYCTMMVKTHLSLSDDPTKKGVPTGWKLTIRDILEYGGAKFLCPMAGTISMMPGTAANPAYRRVDVDVETGKVSGLF